MLMKTIFLENSKKEKCNYIKDDKKEENQAKQSNRSIRVFSVVAILSFLLSLSFIYKLDSKFSSENVISTDYVSVFKETELHDVLFEANENK